MELEIDPEPTPAERAAIEAALARAGVALRPQEPGAWWRAGIAGGADGAAPPDPGRRPAPGHAER